MLVIAFTCWLTVGSRLGDRPVSSRRKKASPRPQRAAISVTRPGSPHKGKRVNFSWKACQMRHIILIWDEMSV
jgi:hypothetical protein